MELVFQSVNLCSATTTWHC